MHATYYMHVTCTQHVRYMLHVGTHACRQEAAYGRYGRMDVWGDGMHTVMEGNAISVLGNPPFKNGLGGREIRKRNVTGEKWV